MYNDNLKALRTEANETQTDLAVILGVSTSAVGMWEQGRRQPDIFNIEKICDHYNVDADFLLFGRRSSYTPAAPLVPELVEVLNKLTPAQQRKLAGMALVMFGSCDQDIPLK